MAYYGVFGTLGQPPPSPLYFTHLHTIPKSVISNAYPPYYSLGFSFFRLRSPNSLNFPLENRFCKGVLKKNRACGEPNTWISPYKITFTKAVLKKIAPAAGQIPIRKSLLKSRFWKKIAPAARFDPVWRYNDFLMTCKILSQIPRKPPLVKSRSENR